MMAVACACLLGCENKSDAGGDTADAPAAVTSSEWNAFVGSFLDRYFALRPDVAVSAGRHEFDGKLPDWSPEGLERFRTFLKNQRARAMEFDTTALDSAERFEREYVIARVDRDLFWLVTADGPHTNPAYYSDALDPDPYLTRPYAPLEQRMKAFTSYAQSVVAAAAQIQANLKGPMARTLIDRGHGAFGGYADFYKTDVPAVFASVTDPTLQQEFKDATDAAIAAMRALDAHLTSLRATQTEDFALGTRFKDMLWKIERVDAPLDELEKLGRADLARNVAALKTECAKFAPGKSIQACMAKMAAHKPAENTLDAARRQLGTLKQFILDKQIVTIPGSEEAKVGESPPYQRYNFAYIMIPGPYEKNMPSTYYVAPPEPNWTAKEKAEYLPGEKNLLFTSAHEVWPGHFLQFLHANRSPSKFGQVFVGYAFAEGWAHYTEEMMWESGLGDGDPETHIGQLSEALLRDARYLSAIRMHTRGMTVEQAERLFRDEAYQDATTAKQQAARGTFDPEYLDYTMGKLMIRKLREDWTASRGGKAAWKEFHDRFLSYGGPPIPLVRRAMLGDAAGPPF